MPHSTYVSVHECAREHTCRQEPEFLRRHQLSGFETVSLSGPELTKFASNTQRSSSARGDYVITLPPAPPQVPPCSTFYSNSGPHVCVASTSPTKPSHTHTHTQCINVQAGKISIGIK